MSFAEPRFGLPNFSGMVAPMKPKATPELADAVRAAMGPLTHDKVHDKGGPSSPVMTNILKGEGATISRDTASKLDRAFGWPEGQAFALATGAGEVIRAQREAAGISRKDFATQLGVGKRSLAEWESGDPIPADILEQIRDMLAKTSEIIAELGRQDPHAS